MGSGIFTTPSSSWLFFLTIGNLLRFLKSYLLSKELLFAVNTPDTHQHGENERLCSAWSQIGHLYYNPSSKSSGILEEERVESVRARGGWYKEKEGIENGKKQCFLETTGKLHIWTQRGHDIMHKVSKSLSQTKPQYRKQGLAQSPTPSWEVIGNW